MKNAKLFFFIFLIISCDDIGKDYIWSDIPQGFTRKYGTKGYDYGWDASYSPFDEGIIIVGQNSREINGLSDLWAIKTNNHGIIEWEKSFGGDDNDVGYSAIPTSDGGFLFVGYTWSYGNEQQVYAIKTDFHGEIKWEKNYGGSMWDVGNKVIEINGGGFIIVGYSNSPRISSGNTDIFLIKIDNNGNMIWQKAYGNLTFPNHEWGYDIIQTPDEGFIIVGARDRYSKGSMNGLVIRIDENGELIWEKELLDESQVNETIYSISLALNGAIYLCSSLNSTSFPAVYQPKITKMDFSGNIEWQRIFNSNGSEFHQYRATNTNLGEIVLIGTSSKKLSIGNKKDAFMVKIDDSGNILWTNAYGSTDEDDWGWSVFETPKRNLVFVGSTKSFGASLFDIYLVSTNSNGITQ